MTSDGRETEPGVSLRHMTLEQIRQLRGQSAARRKRTRIPALIAQERAGSLPLSFSQERFWFLDQLGLVGAAYNVSMMAKLDGNLKISALERSIDELIRRHEILRTRFESEAGVPMQVIDPPKPFALRAVDLSVLEEDEKARQLRESGGEQARRIFDLERGPLLDIRLLKLAQREHVLLLTMHHIVIDGWSWGVFFRELGAIYDAYAQGRDLVLQGPALQYADYAIWQRKWLQGEVLQEQLQYWKERLVDVPPQLQLPADRPRPAAESFRGAVLRFKLSPAVTEGLARLAREEGATLFMVILAAYQALLSRWTGQRDIVIGTPIAGRRSRELEDIIGCFINTLVLRADVSGEMTFRELLCQVKKTTLAAYAHQDVPFEAIVRELHPERDLGRQPLVQVMLEMESAENSRIELSEVTWTWTWTDVERAMTHFDLTLFMSERPEGLVGMFEYAVDLFHAESIERMADHFRSLLDGIVANPDCLVRRLPLLGPGERQRLLEMSEIVEPPSPSTALIHELFEAQVRRAPRDIAAVFGDERLTYADLDARANQLARHLAGLGVAPDDLVGLFVERDLDMVVGVLGILKAGAAYLPLDPAYPAERLAYMLADAAPRIVLTQKRLRASLPETLAQVVALDADGSTIRQHASASLDSRAIGLRCDHLAYVIYTSGSTGKPKGVMVEHRNVTRLFAATEKYFDFDRRDVWTLFHSIAFDFSVWELWGALLYGGRVVVVPLPTARSPEEFYALLCRERVTVLNQTPSAFAQLVHAQAHRADAHSLRVVIFGGEALELRMLRPWVKRNGASRPRLVNMYGITETTVHVTYRPLSEEIIESGQGSLIGKAIPDLGTYLVDHDMQLAPIGVQGEIHVSGAGVTRGYLNQPGLTAIRFIAAPFNGPPSSRMYRSGDLARWRLDRSIEYIGRNDHQVKIRGFRIELGEIEDHLSRHPQVREAVVLAREDERNEKRLVAYVTLEGMADEASARLRAHLRSLLPEYMVPSAFVVLERMPLTSNGKLDRRSLPSPSEGSSQDSYVPPEGMVEQTVAEAWRDLLGLRRVGALDNFFELGGHSLMVVKVLFKINQQLGCALTVTDVYRSATVRELSARICGGLAGDVFVDLAREAVLHREIVALPELPRVPERNVLLTGCTGFVGRFLLSQLLHETGATIHCLVRARSASEALSRVKTTLLKWDLWEESFESRIVVITGDLRAPRLGIDPIVYESLAHEIDSIFHCGTSMHHLETYSMAKPANVQSITELLKFATNIRTKLINHISTLSIFGSSEGGRRRVIDEHSSIDDEKHLTSNGYAASKWVAEKILMIARERGIPCNVFRLGLVWADTEKGRYDELQREYRIFKSALLSGCGIKDYRYQLPPTPVDYVARAILFLARRNPLGGGIFHLSSSSPMEEGVFERWNQIARTSLELRPLYDWIQEIKSRCLSGQSLPVVPLVEYAFSMEEGAFLQSHQRNQSMNTEFDCSRTQRELEGAGIIAPRLSDAWLGAFVDRLIKTDAECIESNYRAGGAAWPGITWRDGERS